MRRLGMRGGILLFALTAAPLLGGCGSVVLIPESYEVAMGVEAAPQFEKEFSGRVPDATLEAYVDEVGQRVAKVCDRDHLEYTYTLVRSKVPNAFALPGGKIFLTAGLMSRMSNERQLAAVLGHETGHVCVKHNVKGMQRQMGTSVLIEVGAAIAGAGDTAKDVAKVVGGVVNLKYSRDDEYEADELGVRYMAKAGYNPYGMVELLTILLNLRESEPGTLEELFQTHPVSSKRIARARAMIDQQHSAYQETAADPRTQRFQDMRARLLKVVPDAR